MKLSDVPLLKKLILMLSSVDIKIGKRLVCDKAIQAKIMRVLRQDVLGIRSNIVIVVCL
jgi:hypothetical protein